MGFRAISFVFDNIPSETYDLFLISEGAAGVLQNTGSSSVELLTETIYRNPKPYLFGVQQTPVMTFSLSFASLKPISAVNQQYIQKWLFGHNTYKKLQIMQCDMYDVYFNCILTNPVVTTVGNFAYYFRCDVICDSPWAWGAPTKLTFNKPTSGSSFIINNTSDNNYYTYPNIVITVSQSGNSVVLTNQTDNNQTFSITGLSANEVLTINSERNIITSSTGLSRFQNMTGFFPRLLPGINSLKITGNISSIVFEFDNARKVSG